MVIYVSIGENCLLIKAVAALGVTVMIVAVVHGATQNCLLFVGFHQFLLDIADCGLLVQSLPVFP